MQNLWSYFINILDLLEKNNKVSFLYSWLVVAKFNILSKTLVEHLKSNLFYIAWV